MAIKNILKRIKECSEKETIHLILQSLNGYGIEKSEVNSEINALVSQIKDHISFADNEEIHMNDLVLLITLPVIKPSGIETFKSVAIDGLINKFPLLESYTSEDFLISLFRIDLAS